VDLHSAIYNEKKTKKKLITNNIFFKCINYYISNIHYNKIIVFMIKIIIFLVLIIILNLHDSSLSGSGYNVNPKSLGSGCNTRPKSLGCGSSCKTVS